MICYPQDPSFYIQDSDSHISCQFTQLVNFTVCSKVFQGVSELMPRKSNRRSFLSTVSWSFWLVPSIFLGLEQTTGTCLEQEGQARGCLLWLGNSGRFACHSSPAVLTCSLSMHVHERGLVHTLSRTVLPSGMWLITDTKWIGKAHPQGAGCFLPVAWSPILQWRRRSWRLDQQRARYSRSDNEVCSRDQQVRCENVPEVCLCSWDGLWKWIVDGYFGRRVEEWHHICLFFPIAWLVPSPGLKPSFLKPRAVILCNWNRVSPTRLPLKSKVRLRATLY